LNGAIAQLGERLSGTQERKRVTIFPLVSNIYRNYLPASNIKSTTL
jgi:hypothetical protein